METGKNDKPYQGEPRNCGLTFSITDFIVIIITALSNGYLWTLIGATSLLIGYVVGHFFLFCNVFRIRRRSELIWGGFFLLNAIIWLLFFNFNIFGLFLSTFILTIVLITCAIRSPFYHGIFAKQLNKSLEDYLAGKI